MELSIKKGGRLVKKYWDSETKSHIDHDVTDQAYSLLFDECELEDGLTLNDIFLLVRKHLDIFSLILKNYCLEITEEALNNEPSDPSDLNYLELYWRFSSDYNIYSDTTNKTTCLHGYSFPHFHGVKYLTEQDIKDDFASDTFTYDVKVGDKQAYAVEFTSPQNLKNLPIQLRNEIMITDEKYIYDSFNVELGSISKKKRKWFNKEYDKRTLKYDNCTYTLGQILYGIFYELSFLGSAAEREKTKEEILERVKEIKDKHGTTGKKLMSF